MPGFSFAAGVFSAFCDIGNKENQRLYAKIKA
jgi:hypothetical protein